MKPDDPEPRIIEVPMRPVRVKALCPNCREGDLQFCDGPITNINYPMYPHKCSACGHTQHIAGKKFPYLDFRDLD